MSHDVDSVRADLLESVRQMRRSEAARVTDAATTLVSVARERVGLEREAFARLLGVSTRTLRDWERGRRTPSGAARTLIRVALHNPEALRDLRP